MAEYSSAAKRAVDALRSTEGSMTSYQLAAAVGVFTNGITGYLKPLVADGYVEVIPGAPYRYRLTVAGRLHYSNSTETTT